MSDWNAELYLRFADERTRPCRDLAARIEVDARRIVDLGCGPGNSTDVLGGRWPQADILGLDSSEEMIAAARRERPGRRWIRADIVPWAAATEPASFDVVFSNAALQWVSDHRAIFPKLLALVAPGGALAVQVPNNIDAPPHAIARALAASGSWRRRLPPEGVREWHAHEAAFYYDVLTPHSSRIDIWETEYLHIMPGTEAIVEWYRATGLRPYLSALPSEKDREEFVAEYLEALRPAFPPRANGSVLFPFQRLFMIAYTQRRSTAVG
jgi:trans-aconitate 2-methyltransferase